MVLESRKEFSAAFAEYDRRLASYNRCMLIFGPSLSNPRCGSAPTPPSSPEFSSGTFTGRGNQPTAVQAAAVAVARLQLPRIPPGIGPSPDINPWNMAAVGYPLWLWADGPTHVGPISDSVAGLSVSLDAEVSSLTFRMGDGHTVTCPGVGPPLDNGGPARHQISELRLFLRQTLIAGQRLHGGSHRQLGCDLDQQRPIGSDQRPRRCYHRTPGRRAPGARSMIIPDPPRAMPLAVAPSPRAS